MARTRLADGSDIPLFDLSFPPMASDGLPVVTFKDSISFHLNDDLMRAVHTPRAHTDGDVVVFFEMANVVHAGDVFFNGIYPVIDTHNGGTLQGACRRKVRMSHICKVEMAHFPVEAGSTLRCVSLR